MTDPFYITISIIKLNVNGINTVVKGPRLSEWVKKKNSTMCFCKDIH